MPTWYAASNITPGDNSGLDMCPNPGAYTDLNDGDIALVMIRNVVTAYTYDSTSALPESLPQVVTPNGNAGNGRWILSEIATKGQNGFATPVGPQSDSLATLGVVGTTFTLTHVADYDFYINGVVYRKTTDQTVEITDVHGLHWIYFDSEGVLQIQAPGGTVDDIILDNCLVAAVYWDAVSNYVSLLFDERHGNSMSPATHYHLHEVLGASYDSGLSLSGFSTDGTGDDAVDAQFDINSGEFHDEDIEIIIPTDTNATIDTFFRQGVGGPWFQLEATAGYVVADGTVGTQLDWNDYNAGDWQLQEVASGRFVLTHYFATNDILSDAGVIGIMGQNTYLSLNAARTGAEVELGTLLTGDLPMEEVLPIGTVIWQTADTYGNQVAARIRSTDTGDDYIDWRTTLPVGSGSTTVDHESLSNLYGGASADHYHLTGTQATDLTDGGDSNLHQHDSLQSSGADSVQAQVDGINVRDTDSTAPEIGFKGNTDIFNGKIVNTATYMALQLGTGFEDGLKLNTNGAAELYYNNVKSFQTSTEGIEVQDNSGTAPVIDFRSDAGVALARIQPTNTAFQMYMWNGSAWEKFITGNLNGATELHYDNLVAILTNADGLIVRDTSGTSSIITMQSDAGVNQTQLQSNATTTLLKLFNGSAWEDALKATLNGSVDLYYNDIKQAETVSGGLKATNAFQIASSGLMTDIKDEDTMASNSATALATQQSIKAYVDTTKYYNTVYNPDFSIWQRGTSFAAAATGIYTADRFSYNKTGTMVHTVSRYAEGPSAAAAGHQSNYSLKVDCTTADAALGAGDYCFIRYKVEGFDFYPYHSGNATFSFWVKATKTGTYCFAVKNGGDDRSYVTEYTVNSTGTWEYKTVTIPMNYSAGTWNWGNGVGLQLIWCLGGGSTYQTTKDTWQSANKFCTSSQVNASDSTSNDFLLSQVRMERGTVATPFVPRPFGEELGLCQRYYEKSYGVEVNPGTATDVGSLYFFSQSTAYYVPVQFVATKRSTSPTAVVYSPVTGAANKTRNLSTSADSGGGAVVGDSGITIQGAAAAIHLFQCHWVVDNEL